MDIWSGLKPVQALVLAELLRHKRIMTILPRQEGKTELVVRAIHDLLKRPFPKSCLFAGKDHKSIKKATYEKFERNFDKELFQVNTEQVYLRQCKTSICYMESVDKDPDRLRGGTYAFIGWTEVAFSKLEKGVKLMDVYEKIIKPTTRKTDGYIMMESTNNGMNEWYDMFTNAGELGFKAIRISLGMLVEMGISSREEYDKLKKETLPLTFAQEYECQFISPKGQVYEEFTDDLIIDVPEVEEWQKVGFAIDWGYWPSATCVLWGYVVEDTAYIFREHYQHKERGEDTAKIVNNFNDRTGAVTIAGVADHEEDRIDELIRMGISCFKADKTNVLGARIEIKTLMHKKRIFIDKSCTNLIRELRIAVWDSRPDKDGEIDEGADTLGHFDGEAALRYWVRSFLDWSSFEEDHKDLAIGNTDIFRRKTRGNHAR